MKKDLKFALFSMLLLCMYGLPFGYSDDITLFDPISVAFTTKGFSLSTGCSGELGEPIQAFLNLYAVKDGTILGKISRMEDLAKLGVEIKTENEALDFLRLFWGVETNYLFKNESEKYLIIKVIDDEENMDFASISKSNFKKFGLKETKVVKSGEKFIVEMNLAKPMIEKHKVAIIRFVSSLTTSGDYKMLSRKDVAVVPPIVVPIPYYE